MKKTKLFFAPFKYSQISVTKKNILVLLLLSLQVFILVFVKDYKAILNIAICITSALLVNFFCIVVNKQKGPFNLSTVSEAIIIAFCTPINYNPIFLFILVTISIFLVKVLFSGYGGNIFSTVAFTIIVLYISFPQYFPENLNDISLLKAHGSSFSILQLKGFIQNDKSITSLLNYFFVNIGVAIPEGYATLLTNNISLIPAFRYNLLTFFSASFLLAFYVGDKIISFVFIFVYAIMVWIFGMYFVDGSFFTGDILVAICTSGIFFYAFFVATESCTVPNSKIGKIFFGIALGLVCFKTCGVGGNPVGVPLAILTLNIFVPVILRIEEYFFNISLRKKYETAA